MRNLQALVGVVFAGLFLAGCGSGERAPGRAARPAQKTRPELGDFSLVGTWHIDNNVFEFTADGRFVRKVTCLNPSGLWWEGEWRRSGNVVYAKYTRGKSNLGDVSIFDINGPDTMTARAWGVFKREKPG